MATNSACTRLPLGLRQLEFRNTLRSAPANEGNRPSGTTRLPRVGRRLRRGRAGHPGAHRSEQPAGRRPDPLALADVHREHRRRIPGGLLHHAVAGAVAVVELSPASARDRTVRWSDDFLDHAGRDAEDDRTSLLRPGGWIHRRQHHAGLSGGLSGYRRGPPSTGALMLLWVGVLIAGGFGAVLRFLVDGAVARRAARSFPFGTLAVNISGAALLGLLGGLALSRHAALLADTAFVGSYTTFSTWMLETQRLSEERQLRSAVANLVASIVLGIAAALAGQWIAGHL